MSPNPAVLTWPALVAGGGIEPAYHGTAQATSAAVSHTFAAMPIGDASSGRTVVVGLTWRRGSGANASSGATIGGIPATLDFSVRNSWQRVEFYRAMVPTGSTADVVVDYATTVINHGAIAATWSFPVAVAVVDVDSKTASPFSVTMDTAASGACIGMVGYATNGPVAWTGALERFDLTSMTTRGSGADAITDGGGLEVAATLSGSVIDPTLAAVTYQGA